MISRFILKVCSSLKVYYVDKQQEKQNYATSEKEKLYYFFRRHGSRSNDLRQAKYCFINNLFIGNHVLNFKTG